MTQEEKQLLLKDLCTRLPYGVKINIKDYYSQKMIDDILCAYHIEGISYNLEYRNLRPYLRPMSSMTERERDEVKKHMKREQIVNVAFYHATEKTYDWYNSHHFDYRGLIPMGLALEASKNMYKTE